MEVGLDTMGIQSAVAPDKHVVELIGEESDHCEQDDEQEVHHGVEIGHHDHGVAGGILLVIFLT